jgi:hypothetical protein
MQLCDLQVEDLFEFLALDVVGTFAEFRDCSPEVDQVASRMPMHLLGFLTHFDDLIDHWHGLTEQFTRSYALPQL